jgi:5-methylcytosine-specific restriction endonuclease McrA
MGGCSFDLLSYGSLTLVATSAVPTAPRRRFPSLSHGHYVRCRWFHGERSARRRHSRVAAMVSNMEVRDVMSKGRGSVLAERTLVLDVGYRPLSIISVRRALLLVLAHKTEVIHASQYVVRSEKLEIFAPSIVRLRYQVGAPYRRRAPLHRRAVFARDDYLCQYCGRRAECIDHVHPRSKGGEHTWENVVACCRTCNVAKGDTLPEHSQFRLRRVPRAPEPMAVAAALRRGVPPEWDIYLPNRLSLSA